jgi:hypothetical protein
MLSLIADLDWFAAGCPDAPRPYAAGPLCTALSSFRQLQRRSTPYRRQNSLLAREADRARNGRLNFACDPTSM